MAWEARRIMLMALDLNSQQTARVMARAVRAHAKLELEPHPDVSPNLIWATLEAASGECLTLRLFDGERGALPPRFIGANCEIRTVLNGLLYLFSSSVLDVRQAGGAIQVLMSPPSIMHVVNRRRYVRKAPVDPVKIMLKPAGAGDSAVEGELWNIGVNGLACRIARRVSDEFIFIGDSLTLQFMLPWNADSFDLRAIVCSKNNTHDPDFVVLGVEFATDAVAEQQHQLEHLRYLVAEETDRLLELEQPA